MKTRPDWNPDDLSTPEAIARRARTIAGLEADWVDRAKRGKPIFGAIPYELIQTQKRALFRALDRLKGENK